MSWKAWEPVSGGARYQVREVRTYNTQQVIRVALAAENAHTGLLLMSRVQTPYPDGRIVGRRGNNKRVLRRRREIVDALPDELAPTPQHEQCDVMMATYAAVASQCLRRQVSHCSRIQVRDAHTLTSLPWFTL